MSRLTSTIQLLSHKQVSGLVKKKKKLQWAAWEPKRVASYWWDESLGSWTSQLFWLTNYNQLFRLTDYSRLFQVLSSCPV